MKRAFRLKHKFIQTKIKMKKLERRKYPQNEQNICLKVDRSAGTFSNDVW